MQKLIDEAVIKLAENLQLPERVFNIEDYRGYRSMMGHAISNL